MTRGVFSLHRNTEKPLRVLHPLPVSGDKMSGNALVNGVVGPQDDIDDKIHGNLFLHKGLH